MSTIISISKKRSGFLIVTDEEKSYWFPKEAWYEYDSIQESTEIDDTELTAWLIPRQYQSAIAYTVSLLALRDRSSGEIHEKLTKAFYLPETIELTLYKLQKEHLLDDQVFAEKWAFARTASGIGSTRIKQELRRKGISDGIISRTLMQIEEEETENSALYMAQKALKKYHSESDYFKKKRKILSFLLRRGFTMSESMNAIEKALQSAEE